MPNQKPLTDSTKELLLGAHWYGNVRELQSVMETAFERCVADRAMNLLPEYFGPEVTLQRSPKAEAAKNQDDESDPSSQLVPEPPVENQEMQPIGINGISMPNGLLLEKPMIHRRVPDTWAWTAEPVRGRVDTSAVLRSNIVFSG